MSNKLKIEVTAADKAGGILDGLSGKINKMQSAAGKAESVFGKIGTGGPGLARLESAVSRLGTGIAAPVNSLTAAASGLGVLDGTMGLLTSATSLAGMAALVNHWGQMGVATANVAGNIGIGTGRLRTLQRVATLAGLSTDDMTGSLRGLAGTLQDAAFGRNNEVAAMLNTLGIGMKRTKAGAVDTEAALGDLADAIAKQTNPQTQARIAAMFGVEALLPILRKGRAGWQDYIRDAERYGVVSDEAARKSEELGRSLNGLKSAVEGVGDTIEGRLAGKLTPIIDEVTSFTAANREAVATWATLVTGIGVASGAASALAKLTGKTALAARVGTALTGPAGLLIGAGALAYEMMPEEKRKVTVRKQTEKEKQEQEASGWPSWLPRIGIDWSKTPGAVSQAKPIVPNEQPSVADGAGQPIGIRNNNPGNLRQWPGAASSGGFAKFATPEQGLAAAARNLIVYQDKYGINTLGGIASRWAPRSDGNDPAAYAASLSRQTGILPNQPLNLRDKDTLAPLLSAIIKQENGQQPYSQQQVEQAVKVTIEMSGNVPPGTNVSAQNANASGIPPRIEYAMPSFAQP